MSDGWANTRAEREWLAALRRIADATEVIAGELERLNARRSDTLDGSGDETPAEIERQEKGETDERHDDQ